MPLATVYAEHVLLDMLYLVLGSEVWRLSRMYTGRWGHGPPRWAYTDGWYIPPRQDQYCTCRFIRKDHVGDREKCPFAATTFEPLRVEFDPHRVSGPDALRDAGRALLGKLR